MLEKLTKKQLIETINVINTEPKYKLGEEVFVIYYKDKDIQCPHCNGAKAFDVNGVKAFCASCRGRGYKSVRQISVEDERDKALIESISIEKNYGKKENCVSIRYSVIGAYDKKWTGHFDQRQLSKTLGEAQEKCKIYNEKEIKELF